MAVYVDELYVSAPLTPVEVCPTNPIGSIGSLKVAVTAAFKATLVAPFIGETATMVGGVVSGALAVTNVNKYGCASGIPNALFAVVVIVTVYAVWLASGLPG